MRRALCTLRAWLFGRDRLSSPALLLCASWEASRSSRGTKPPLGYRGASPYRRRPACPPPACTSSSRSYSSRRSHRRQAPGKRSTSPRIHKLVAPLVLPARPLVLPARPFLLLAELQQLALRLAPVPLVAPDALLRHIVLLHTRTDVGGAAPTDQLPNTSFNMFRPFRGTELQRSRVVGPLIQDLGVYGKCKCPFSRFMAHSFYRIKIEAIHLSGQN